MDTPLYGFCHLPLLSMRAEGSHRSELVNQLLSNEIYTCIAETDEWYKIISWHDQYEGWIPKNQFQSCSQSQYELLKNWYAHPQQATLLQTDRGLSYLGTPSEKQNELSLSIQEWIEVGKRFINTPYLWGGRSIAGIDCSGLMQVLFRLLKISLPRDAYQQAEQGEEISFKDKRAGDLAFFHNKAGKITHVGLVLDGQKILHASAWVRIDTLTNSGILHNKEETHQLKKIIQLIKD